MSVASVVAVLLVLAGIYMAGLFDKAPEQGTENQAVEPTAATTPTDEPKEIPGETIGTPDNPYSAGDSFTFEDWTFTLGQTDTDAWPELAPRFERDLPDIIHEFQPEPGMVFVSVHVSMTYTGSPATQNRANGHSVYHIAADGTETGDGNCGRGGAAVDFYDYGAYSHAPFAEGTSCVEILPEQVEGGLWRIDMFFTDDRYVEFFYTAE